MTASGTGPTDGGGPTDGDSAGESGRPDANPPGPPPVGPLAVEAALLLDVMADRLTAMRPAESDAGQSSHGPASDLPPDLASDPAPGPPPPAPPQAPPTGSTRSAPRLGSDGRCPECGSIPGASCTACPLCRFLAVLRGERPEATAKLVDGALLIVRTLRSLLPDAEPAAAATGGATPGEHRSPGPPASSARRPGGLEHIDIR